MKCIWHLIHIIRSTDLARHFNTYVLFVVQLALFAGLSLWFEARAEESLALLTADGKEIAASYYKATRPNSPAIMLLLDTRCDRMNFGGFP